MTHRGLVIRPHVRSWLAALLLSTGWSAAQTGQAGSGQSRLGQSQSGQSQSGQSGSALSGASQVAPTPPAPGPAQSAVGVTASPTDALISALRRSLLQEARGEAVLELVFPPSSAPIRRARALPRLGAGLALIRRNFVVTAAPDTVAGRSTTRYLLTPNNAQAAHWTIWIDVRWKVPLAYQERLPDGALARRAELLSVNPGLNRLTARAVQTPVPGLKKALLRVLPGLNLPAGFEPLRVRAGAAGDAAASAPVGNSSAGPGATEVVLSDGLNVLVMVVSSRAVQPASGVAVRRLGAQSVWLVGNLPQNILEGALSSIRRLDPLALSSMMGTFGRPVASEE